MKRAHLLPLAFHIGLPLALGAAAGFVGSSGVNDWFEEINHPSFRPPNWLFGPVWTMLYILMGLSAYIISQNPKTVMRERAMVVYYIQLLLNFMWTFIFFFFKRFDIALAEIVVLLLDVMLVVYLFARIRPLAAWLNVPYLLWLVFATALNYAYVKLN